MFVHVDLILYVHMASIVQFIVFLQMTSIAIGNPLYISVIYRH